MKQNCLFTFYKGILLWKVLFVEEEQIYQNSLKIQNLQMLVLTNRNQGGRGAIGNAFCWLLKKGIETIKADQELGKGAEKDNRKKYGLLPNPPRTPPPVWSFLRENKLTPIFFGNWIYDCQNEFYTWSHWKIYFFCTVIMVYFFH